METAAELIPRRECSTEEKGYHNYLNVFYIVFQVHDMEASQQTFSSKSTEEIDSLRKANIELEERVASTEMKLQEKNQVSTFLD